MDESRLMSIGTFARITGLSVTALRHYDATGLLRPARITEAGYRLYSCEQLPRAELLHKLRSFGIPLDEVAQALDAPRNDLRASLTAHGVEVRREIHRLENVLADLDDFIAGGAMAESQPIEYRMNLERLAEVRVVGERATMESAAVDAWVADALARAAGVVAQLGEHAESALAVVSLPDDHDLVRVRTGVLTQAELPEPLPPLQTFDELGFDAAVARITPATGAPIAFRNVAQWLQQHSVESAAETVEFFARSAPDESAWTRTHVAWRVDAAQAVQSDEFFTLPIPEVQP